MKKENLDKWLLVYTKPQEEKRAKKHLENQGFEVFLPMISVERISQTKLITIEAMFPRYLFTRINAATDKWNQIKSTRGVSHLIMFGQTFAEVPKQIVTFLKERVDERGVVSQKISRHEFRQGEQLVIKQGILEGREAIFLSKKSKERVRVLLRAVNQQIITEVPATDVGQKEVIETFKL